MRVEQHAQQRRDQHHPGDAVFGEQGDQVLRVDEHRLRDEHARHAVQQGAEQFPQRIDEVEGGLAGGDIAGNEGIFPPHPGQAVEELALLDQNALWSPGRARGEHHVAQAGGARRADRASGCLAGDCRPVAVETQHLGVVRGQYCQPAGLGEKQCDGAVFEHGRDALTRVAGVDRHVAAPRLENRQDGDEQLGGAFHRDADQGFMSDANLAQVVRKLAGTLVEFPVAQARVGAENGRRVGTAVRLYLEKARQRRIGRVVAVGGVPLVDKLPPFAVAKQA
ncbi:MAG: hypothetical protein CAPSK01_003145 [Candidatus Accumulibacter vicinus]|uniref:Uncharacterized protein n=1 Tax=Candidatus Accumulibacter vicinus TaxID=2954382 RepID=A0A084XY43_9PROT|nr:MAG: hypothetical protein CAPSK01_003145 [Candidatus Accumulibacter vicinus]